MKRILVAGIGNVFLGDDAFGVEAARRLAQRQLPEEVRVVDFGIRGLDLAYALLDGYDLVILIDAICRGGAPGKVYVIEAGKVSLTRPERIEIDAHHLVPDQALQLARALGGPLPLICVIGCEPATLEPDPIMSLSEPVQAAVDPVLELVQSLIAEMLESGRIVCMS